MNVSYCSDTQLPENNGYTSFVLKDDKVKTVHDRLVTYLLQNFLGWEEEGAQGEEAEIGRAGSIRWEGQRSGGE